MKKPHASWTNAHGGDCRNGEDRDRQTAGTDPFAELGELFENALDEMDGRFDGVVMY